MNLKHYIYLLPDKEVYDLSKKFFFDDEPTPIFIPKKKKFKRSGYTKRKK